MRSVREILFSRFQPRDGLQVYLVRAVVDSKRPGLGKGARRGSVVGNTTGTKKLNRAVGDVLITVRYRHFDHRNLLTRGFIADSI